MGPAEPERLLAGRYRFQAIIGRGGMGVVWRARDELLGRDVAVKEIIWPPHMDTAERDIARRRALREAQMAARLSHPNVVGVYDIVEEDGRPWLVMELVPHRSLRDAIMADGPLSPARAAQVGLGILAALRAAHDAGVLHRDVKPANVLLAPGGRVVLTDFGIARADDSPALTGTGVLIGSPSYISPERARGEPADAAGDMWALGACLYAAVEGRPPFERDGALASLTAVVTDEPDPPSRAGPLWPVISGLLRKEPTARLGADDVEEMLRPISTPAEPAPAAAPVPASAPAQPAEPDPEPAAREPDAEPTAQEPDAEPTAQKADAEPALGEPDAAPEQAAPIAEPPPRDRSRVALAAAAAVTVTAAGVIAGVLATAGAPHHGSAAHTAGSSPAPKQSATRAAIASPTASPSGPAASRPATAPSGTGTLPAGYHRFTNSTGFSIGGPAGWQISHDGHYIYARDPANSGIFLLIDQSDQPQPNALADWQQQAAARQSSYPGYHLIRLQAVRYPQAEQAADWEFTYNRGGIEVHILNRNILANAHHAYALYWSVPESSWNADYHYFQAFAATFRPAGVNQG